MKVLLISPTFHGYWRSISHGFSSLGHSVECVVYDELPNPVAKMANQVRVNIPERLGVDRMDVVSRRASGLVATALNVTDADVVVVVKGDVLDGDLWAPLRRRGIPTVLWLYDELRRTRYSSEVQLNAYTAVATYSPDDCRTLLDRSIAASTVPLAFDPRMSLDGEPTNTDVVFVGARYPKRESLLAELVRRGVPVRAFGRDWSHGVVDRIRTLDWARPKVPAGADVSREAAALLLHDAVVALNLHGDQDGFNIRTFEACGVGAVQLIDRSDVAPLFEPDRELLVFESADEIVDLVDRVQRDRVWSSAIRRAGQARTLAEHTFAHRCARLLELC